MRGRKLEINSFRKGKELLDSIKNESNENIRKLSEQAAEKYFSDDLEDRVLIREERRQALSEQRKFPFRLGLCILLLFAYPVCIYLIIPDASWIVYTAHIPILLIVIITLVLHLGKISGNQFTKLFSKIFNSINIRGDTD